MLCLWRACFFFCCYLWLFFFLLCIRPLLLLSIGFLVRVSEFVLQSLTSLRECRVSALFIAPSIWFRFLFSSASVCINKEVVKVYWVWFCDGPRLRLVFFMWLTEMKSISGVLVIALLSCRLHAEMGSLLHMSQNWRTSKKTNKQTIKKTARNKNVWKWLFASIFWITNLTWVLLKRCSEHTLDETILRAHAVKRKRALKVFTDVRNWVSCSWAQAYDELPHCSLVVNSHITKSLIMLKHTLRACLSMIKASVVKCRYLKQKIIKTGRLWTRHQHSFSNQAQSRRCY